MHERRSFFFYYYSSVPHFLLSSLSEIVDFFHRNCGILFTIFCVYNTCLVCIKFYNKHIHENKTALRVHQHVSSSIHRRNRENHLLILYMLSNFISCQPAFVEVVPSARFYKIIFLFLWIVDIA